jgi:DNA-binding FadR family transcriptional regulator
VSRADESRRRASLVADALLQRVSGAPPGRRLGTIAQLRDDFDVAGATMTEAVRLLEQRGSVTVRKGRAGGVFVATPQRSLHLERLLADVGDPYAPDDVRELVLALEPAVAAGAASHATDRERRELIFLLERLSARADDGDAAAFRDAELALLRRLASLCPNPVLRGVYEAALDLEDVMAGRPAATQRSAALARCRELVAALDPPPSATAAGGRSG